MNASQNPLVLMYVPLPPPTTGMTTANKAMVRVLSEEQIDVEIFNTSAKRSKYRLLFWPRKAFSMSKALLRLRRRLSELKRSGRHAVLYVSLQSGGGSWFDLVVARLAARHRLHVVLHHHSFAYIRHRQTSIALIAGTPAKVTHIVLSNSMESLLVQNYPEAQNSQKIVLGNSWIDEDALQSSPKELSANPTPLALGHLSNLSAEKGLYHVMRLFEALRSEGVEAKLFLAGPAGQKDAQNIESFASKHDSLVEWSGPIYGSQKMEWFNKIDIFLFPSEYSNEAYPLVILEALASGAPVLASDIGCIGDMANTAQMQAIPIEKFPDVALSQIKSYENDRKLLKTASVNAQASFHQLWSQDEESLSQLTSSMRSNFRAASGVTEEP